LRVETAKKAARIFSKGWSKGSRQQEGPVFSETFWRGVSYLYQAAGKQERVAKFEPGVNDPKDQPNTGQEAIRHAQ